jgi:histidinol-phosphate aminotransferase
MCEVDRRQWLKWMCAGASAVAVVPGLARAAGAAPAQLRARLSLNENPLGPSPLVKQALEREFANLSRYTGREAEELVSTIAAQEHVPAEQILLGEILEPLGVQLGLQGGSGGEFLYSTPGYTALVDTAATVGGIGVPVPLDAGLCNDLAGFTRKLSTQTRAVFLVNPHNPSGTLNDTRALKQFIVQTAQKTLVIVDEAYLEFTADFTERSCVDLVRAGHNVIVFRTFAKAYGLAGLEIGYGVLPLTISKRLKALGLGNPHLLNRFSVVAASASLRDPDFIKTTRIKVANERQRWFDLFDSKKLRYAKSRGNFVFFESGKPQQELAGALLRQGIDIGRAFPPLDRWARISIGLPEENELARRAVAALVR